MEKLLRILFVMSAIAFVTTITACADKKEAKTTSILKFISETGVTIDKTKEVYKITVDPTLLTYTVAAGGPGVGGAAAAPADLFSVTFTDDTQQGFIIPTTADKAEDLTTKHSDTKGDVIFARLVADAPNDITNSFLVDPAPGFIASEINAAWSALGPRAAAGGAPEFLGVPNILTDTKVRVMCDTTMNGVLAASFATEAPGADDDVAIAKGTETKCIFSLVGNGSEIEKDAAYKAWAIAAVAAAKDDPTKNIQKMGFVGIVTGKNKASEITKTAGELLNKDIAATTSANLVKAYDSVLQKVEIVIVEAK